ncbi:MAG TPA: hypothetical protein VM388_10190, partial [Acidimicrobiales bacterium]|nr:hypothetical protein [Acidimicrobiales bacterium]
PPAPARAFWRAAPGPAAPAAGAVGAAVRLAPGVTLVLDAAPGLGPDDARAITTAAAGLLAHLHAAGLLDDPAPSTPRSDRP